MGTVEILLRGPLVSRSGVLINNGRIEMPVDNGVTVLEILSQLDIPSRHVGLVVINGKKDRKEKILQKGDKLVIFPVVAGG